MEREATLLTAVITGLLLTGVLVIFSATGAGSHASVMYAGGDADYFILRHLMYLSAGVSLFLLAALFDYNHLRDPRVFQFVVCIALLMLIAVLVPGVGIERNGATRWLGIGNLTLQPSEFAKFAVILLLAVKLSENQDALPRFWKGLVPPLFSAGVFMGLILIEGDLGVPVVIGTTAVLMIFVAGARWRHLVPVALLAIPAVLLLILSQDYRRKRLLNFLDPWQDELDTGYQLIQSMAAFARGGVFGLGSGASEQKLTYLPDSHTDFAFAIWGEEMGLLGTLLVLGLFACLLILAFRIARGAPNLFGTLLAVGITSLIVFQAGFNMAMATGLVPTKGLPLPYISYGGSALLSTMLLSGVLINIGRQAQEPKVESKAQKRSLKPKARTKRSGARAA